MSTRRGPCAGERRAPGAPKLTVLTGGGYHPGVPATLPLVAQRLVVVTGKGGVGKSALAAALARAAAAARRRVLAVEVGKGRLGPLLSAEGLGLEPRPVGHRLHAATIDPEDALGDFVLSVLRFKMLARRLLESTSFQVLAAAAPGLPEYLVLHKLWAWLEAHRLGRPTWDLIVVDAPASGHSLPLLQAPRTLGALASLSPVGEGLRRMDALLTDPGRTLVCLVTTPEELAVRETIELHRELAALGLPLAPPIVNAVPPRRFSSTDEVALERSWRESPDHPHLLAARFHVERRHVAVEQVGALRRALKTTPLRLPFLFDGPESPGGMARLADELGAAAGLAA